MQKSSDSGFTLIELLVVIAIIAILIGIAFPAFTSVMESTRKTQAKNDEQQIVTAVSGYYTEYGKYPVNVASGNTTDAYFGTGTTPTGATSYTNNDALIDVLRNNTSSTNNSATVTLLNPRGIVFLNVPPVKNNALPISGVIPNGATGLGATGRIGVWYDSWGSPYNILIDTNYSNSVTNPYSDTSPPGGITLNNGVIVWAFGKNGVLGGGPAATGFTSEGGTAGKFSRSGDVISWQ